MAAVGGGGGGGDACAISFNELVQSHRLQVRKEFFPLIFYPIAFAVGSSTLKAFGCPFANQ